MSAPRPRPLGDLLRLLIGPGLWFSHLTILYGAEALICTPPMASGRAMIWIASGATIAALGALAVFGAALLRQPPPAERPEEHIAAFLHATALLLAVLSALGVVWTASPVALLPVCAPVG